MKKISLLFTVVGVFGFQSCSGPEGPQGPTGYNVEAEVFEVFADFTTTNNFSTLVNLNPTILSSDMILVYRRFDIYNGADVWRLIPQTVYLSQGNLDYNYDFTKNDINIFLDADFDLRILPVAYSQNQLFRIVIIPGYFSSRSNIDFKDYHEVIKFFNIDDTHVKRLENK
jgi:hypothetical protein